LRHLACNPSGWLESRLNSVRGKLSRHLQQPFVTHEGIVI
jgi:hypothetical protein